MRMEGYKIIQIFMIFPKRIHNTSCKFIWTGCRSNNSWKMIICLTYIFLIYACGNCSMCINYIIAVFINLADGICGLFLTAEITIEISKLCFHLICDGIFAALT